MEIEYISWSKAIALCYKLAEKILDSGYIPDVIVAVLRGGVVPALIISDYLGIEEFYAIRAKHWGIGSRKLDKPAITQIPKDLRSRRVLVVDEVVDTGLTLKNIVDILKNQDPLDIRTAVLHVKSTTQYLPDYYVEFIKKWKWIFYPWSVVETLYSLVQRDTSTNTKDEIFGKVKELIELLGVEEPGIDTILKGI
ncbi:MAG TPA: phosphoribosyltransferase, partial [Desulfurococcaceae archaeon]|nr:phosphoribosyltransferase [Desulfurococcaceae archaeon]